MWTGKLVHALSMTFAATLHFEMNPVYGEIENDIAYFLYLLLCRTYQYVIDFFNMMSLLYLFYC